MPLVEPEWIPALGWHLQLVTAATGVQETTMATFTAALEPLVPTVVQLLAEDLRLDRSEGRGRLAYLLRVLPLLCKEAWELWRKEDEAKQLLTLCDYLYDSGHRSRYLDGVLPGADPADWDEPLDPSLAPTEPQAIIALESILSNRRKWAEKMVESLSKIDCLQPTAVAFHQFIVTQHCAWKLHDRYRLYFGVCQREGCSRPALRIPPSAEEESTEPDDAPSDAEYWKCCRDGRAPPPSSSLPSDMSFCCHGCYRATNAEFKRLVKFDIATPLCQSRGQPKAPCPDSLYRAAVKRNIGIARELKAMTDVKTKHYPRTMANREAMLREYTTMLSVDLGLLFAASIVAQQSGRTRTSRSLPNAEDWRKHGKLYFNPICFVRDVYLKYGRGELARGGNELWLRRLHDRALKVFE